ncbi:TPA: hypothetical protein DDW69_01330 [candidate division CPR2 bacterium]|nr:MAG: hypothetical protein A2Y26_03890 [candidate division CPR2 bacterium GWD2_39_7]HBG81462.1 hypothetical protein [candidate division CPR2 bacterium]HCL99573.1 hypothetical protein [candidate division CPR2 bacterium]
MKKEKSNNLIVAFQLFEIGYRISIPLVVLILVGNVMDKRFGTKPLFILLGIFVSLFTSSYAIYKSIKKITK